MEITLMDPKPTRKWFHEIPFESDISENPLTMILETNKSNAIAECFAKHSSPEERLIFEKWHEDNRKICHRKSIFGTKLIEGSSVQSHGLKMLSLVKKLEDLKDGLHNYTYIDMILLSLPPCYDLFVVNYNMNGLQKSVHELIKILVQYEITTHRLGPSELIDETSTSKKMAKEPDARRGRRKMERLLHPLYHALSASVAPMRMGKGKGKARGSKRSKTNDV
ncbi:UNVERIFIED_CONTAM: hypothetical protein Scaly_3098200 [Sesamum calycinum]|uniref:Uncharacterized protein n=1 Tax=Sesamum calycinum TaxID=2727403 RepID=A0AAW2JLR6_9LAMI